MSALVIKAWKADKSGNLVFRRTARNFNPAVAMAACVGMPHPKWDERPIIAVVKRPGAEVTRDALLAFFDGKTAKWQIPDDVVFVDAIPLGATGKMLKTRLREVLKDYRLPGV